MTRLTSTEGQGESRFSEMIERARSGKPQIITRNRRTAVVVVAAEKWERKTKRHGNLAEFFATSPLRGAEIKVERATDRPRKPDL